MSVVILAVLVNPLDGAMGACGTISIFVAANDCNSDYLCVTSDLQILANIYYLFYLLSLNIMNYRYILYTHLYFWEMREVVCFQDSFCFPRWYAC